jgi:glycine/D-amino acid oxidase-like deaminating enzyme
MAYDSRILLHYFRLLPDRRFLFGGRGGLSAAPASAATMQKRLSGEFRQMFPAWRAVEISYFWRGLACLAGDRVPHIALIDNDPELWLGAAYHGNGVAMATWTGSMLARLIAGQTGAVSSLPAMMQRPPPRFPLPLLRLCYLGMAYFGYRIKDEWL